MNYGEKHIPIIPFVEWDKITINYNNDTLTIPNEIMLNELIITPMPDTSYISSILEQYNIPQKTRKEIRGILCFHKNENPLQAVIDKLVKTKNSDRKLISRLCLEIYRLSQPYDLNSQLILKHMSDGIVKKIRREVRENNSFDQNIKEILTKKETLNISTARCGSPGKLDLIINYLLAKGEDLNHSNYKLFKYHELTINYFDEVSPLPVSFLPIIKQDEKLSFFIQDLHKKMFKPNLTKDRKDYHERIKESCRSKSILFSNYHRAQLYTYKVYQLLAQEYPEFVINFNDRNHKVVASNYLQSQDKGLKHMMLLRCEFCYRFRWFNKRGNGTPALHCKEDNCNNAYKNWLNHLKKIDRLIERLYKQGFEN